MLAATTSYDDNFLTSDVAPRRHAACDECRYRKIKCSGEQTGCRRCIMQSLFCHYSIQKQMGRPPKKRMRESDIIVDLGSSGSIAEIDREWSSADLETDAFPLCPPVFLNQPALESSANPETMLDQFHRLQLISATGGPWSNFSTRPATSSELIPYPELQGVLQCSCLPSLYLCLSTLSTLTSTPISIQTLNSLCTTARIAQSVIHCEICPRTFATRIQNVTMLGTLVSVIADAWLRVSQANAEDLGKQTACPAYQTSITDDPQGAKAAWRQWLRQIVRRSVIGGHLSSGACTASVACDLTPDLLTLIKEIETRQRRWHAEGIWQYTLQKGNPDCNCPSMLFSSNKMSSESMACTGDDSLAERDPHRDQFEEKNGIDERDILCLKVIGVAKNILRRFDFRPSEYPQGVQPL